MESEEKKKPVDSDKLWPCEYAVWVNETQNGSSFETFEFSRTYKDREGKDRTEKIRLRRTELVLHYHLVGQALARANARSGHDSGEQAE